MTSLDSTVRETHDPGIRHCGIQEGEVIRGVVTQMPRAGTRDGNQLYIREPNGLVHRLPATARKGHAVLERELQANGVQVGDEVSVAYHGKRQALDGERTYRLYTVTRHGC